MGNYAEGAANAIRLAYRDDPPSGEDTEAIRARVMQAIEQLASGDEEAFWAIFDADVAFHEAQCLPYGGTHRGLAATRGAHDTIYDYFESIQIELEQILAAGDIVIAYAWMTYRVRKNGRSGRFPLAEVFRFKDGKVIEWRLHYFDAATVAADIAAD